MKKKQESQDFELEIDVLKLFKFFIHNGGIFLIFIIVSVSLTLINHKYSGESNAFFTGTSVIKLTSTERNFTARAKKGLDTEREARNSSVNLLMAAPMLFQGGKFDYPKLNLLKASIPGYIELISKKNVNPSSDDEKILKNKRHESFKVENFAALRTLKDISWVENNISGANGRNIAAKPNSVPVSNIKLFGEDYIYEAYEDIHITAKGGSKETVKAMLENTQTALGRLIQYSATKKWITDNIYSLILEKAQIKHLLAKSPGKEKDVQLRVKFLKNALEKNIEEKLPTSTEVYFKGAPQALIPLETRIFELKTLLEDLKRNKTKQKDRLKIIELEEKLFALYESNFAENFTKLSPPEFDVLREPVLQEFKNISFEEVETRAVLTGHLRSLKLVELMPKIFTQDPFISYTIFYEGYPRKIIWGASAGIFLAFTFISIRSISRNRGLIQDKKSTK